MAKNKTTQTIENVSDFIELISDEKKRSDFKILVALMEKRTGFSPKMWGTNIVGFGFYAYKYESGHSGEAPYVGLAPRANAITLYLGSEFENREQLLAQLGKHKSGKGCIYVQKIEDINTDILAEMVVKSMEYHKKMHG